jgi:hypothetical protein
MAVSTATVRRVRRLPVAAAAVAGGVLAVETAIHLVDFRVFDLRYSLLDSGAEWSYSHILATAAFAAGAITGLATAARVRRRRGLWAAAGGLFAVLLADNVTRLHTHIGPWPVIYVPILAGLGIVLVALARDTSLEDTMLLGLGLLGFSLALHVVGHAAIRAAGWGPTTWGYQIKVAVKEGTELAGWCVLVPALIALARRA